jgi:anti-sigma-K factor RskA
MTPEERSELASLHALSLLEGQEAALANHLEATDPAFAAEVAAFADAAAAITELIPPIQPSDLLRERVLSMVNAPRPARTKSWIGWAAAAVFAISAIALWSNVAGQRNAIVATKQRAEQLEIELAKTRGENNLAGLRIASLEGQIEEFKGTRAVVVWDTARGEGKINLVNLPPAERDKVYQLWIVDPAHKNPVNGGLIHRETDGSATLRIQPAQMVHEASAFAISIERTGGVDVAEGPIVFIGK